MHLLAPLQQLHVVCAEQEAPERARPRRAHHQHARLACGLGHNLLVFLLGGRLRVERNDRYVLILQTSQQLERLAYLKDEMIKVLKIIFLFNC